MFRGVFPGTPIELIKSFVHNVLLALGVEQKSENPSIWSDPTKIKEKCSSLDITRLLESLPSILKPINIKEAASDIIQDYVKPAFEVFTNSKTENVTTEKASR